MIFRENLLEGQVAIITGGGTGIGFGIATAMAKYGANVVIASRKPEHFESAAEKLRTYGVKVLPLETNVRDPDSTKSMVDRAVQEFGHVDILVNNAAGNFYAPSAELSPNGWRAVVETDLYGTFFCSQAVYPVMERQGSGRIISISMTLHYRGWPQMAHATAAKAGVDALTKTLAKEWAAAGITVNAIAPGPMPTEGATNAFATGDAGTTTIDAKLRDHIPVGRWGAPEDIGNMAVYLASSAGDWITGAILVVDGGSSLARV
ncbi:MAG: SDR family oxidoreductase [Gemmatimonadales bacterium]